MPRVARRCANPSCQHQAPCHAPCTNTTVARGSGASTRMISKAVIGWSRLRRTSCLPWWCRSGDGEPYVAASPDRGSGGSRLGWHACLLRLGEGQDAGELDRRQAEKGPHEQRDGAGDEDPFERGGQNALEGAGSGRFGLAEG